MFFLVYFAFSLFRETTSCSSSSIFFLEWLGLALNLSLLVIKGLLFEGFFGVSGTVRGNRGKDYMRMYRER